MAASAAALTVGCFTVPVYEIYKVGEEVHWAEGLNLLGRFGLPLVVIPHWNNAEGGTHDTRFCYMGEPRLRKLESLLPEPIPILGVDEHTCCILDFRIQTAQIRGIGGVVWRHRGEEKVFKDGQILPLEELRKWPSSPDAAQEDTKSLPMDIISSPSESIIDRVRSFRKRFEEHLQKHEGAALIDLWIGLDKMIWKSSREFEDEEKISEAREELRRMVVELGLRFDEAPHDVPSILGPWIDLILDLRERLRQTQQWKLADDIRDRLLAHGVIVEDTSEGPKWKMK